MHYETPYVNYTIPGDFPRPSWMKAMSFSRMIFPSNLSPLTSLSSLTPTPQMPAFTTSSMKPTT